MPKEIKSIADLTHDPRNANKHTERGAGMMEKSIEETGFGDSLTVDKNGVIISGNQRGETLGSLGMMEPIVVQSDGTRPIIHQRVDLDLSTDERAKKLALFSNRVGELNLNWDLTELSKLEDEGVDLSHIFSDKEFALMKKKAGIVTEGHTDPDEIPEVRKHTDIVRGDLFMLGAHRLLCGDSADAAHVQAVVGADRHVDVLLSDPPYCSGGFQEAGKAPGSIGTRGDETIANDALSTRGYKALLGTVLANVPTAIAYLFTDWRMWVNLFDVVESKGFSVRNMIVWDKETPGMGQGWRMQHELIMCGVAVSSPFDPKAAQGNVIRCTRTGNVHHPTEKPVELLTTILKVTNFCELVIDPFCGSGSTIIAAEQLGIAACGVELAPHFVQVTIDRWEAFTGQKAVKLGNILGA